MTLLLSLAGLAVAGYLAVEHYRGEAPLACPENSVVNCAKVTSSAQSLLLGVPVALLGLLFFAGMTLLMVPPAWRSPSRTLRAVRVVAAASGVAMIMWLIYAELFVINAICLWCTAVHAIALLLFVAVVLATSRSMQPVDDWDDLDDDELDEPSAEPAPDRQTAGADPR